MWFACSKVDAGVEAKGSLLSAHLFLFSLGARPFRRKLRACLVGINCVLRCPVVTSEQQHVGIE